MKDFNYYLNKIGEIGFVEQILHSLVYVSGLPGVHPNEVVIFESGDIGLVISMGGQNAEILILSEAKIRAGSQLVRTGELLKISVGEGILGRVLDPLGRPLGKSVHMKNIELRSIDRDPEAIIAREEVKDSLETGVALVDLVVPIAKGQRELVIGDRKTGKTQFLLQTVISQAKKGITCIYAVIGQRHFDFKKLEEFFGEKEVMKNIIIVASSSSDPSGLVYLTPYTAMTVAEYFRDQGKDVLVILDDMTTHATYYREISLLARRFPGRSSYPGDIFYVHAKIMERAGKFKKGSITCLPVAGTVLGDLSGYIQTNLMSMTDGHIFFDIDLYNQGRRPAVNPFLSVTRVGHRAQTPLQRDISHEVSSFLVVHERMRQYMHFGAEVSENVQKILALGEKLIAFFNQPADTIMSANLNTLLLAGLWVGVWKEVGIDIMKREMEQITLSYGIDDAFRKKVDELAISFSKFGDLVNSLRHNDEIILEKINRKK